MEDLIHLLKGLVRSLRNEKIREDGSQETETRKEYIRPISDVNDHGGHRDTDTEIGQPNCGSGQPNTLRSL